MSKRVKISKLCIEIDGKKLELTMKQAKELNEVLNDTFGGSEVIFQDRWHYPQPYWHSGVYYSAGTCTGSTLTSTAGYASTTTGVAQLSSSTDSNTGWNGSLSGNTVTLTAAQ